MQLGSLESTTRQLSSTSKEFDYSDNHLKLVLVTYKQCLLNNAVSAMIRSSITLLTSQHPFTLLKLNAHMMHMTMHIVQHVLIIVIHTVENTFGPDHKLFIDVVFLKLFIFV